MLFRCSALWVERFSLPLPCFLPSFLHIFFLVKLSMCVAISLSNVLGGLIVSFFLFFSFLFFFFLNLFFFRRAFVVRHGRMQERNSVFN